MKILKRLAAGAFALSIGGTAANAATPGYSEGARNTMDAAVSDYAGSAKDKGGYSEGQRGVMDAAVDAARSATDSPPGYTVAQRSTMDRAVSKYAGAPSATRVSVPPKKGTPRP